MSKKLIWIVTVVMGVAMAALILLQAYWIKNSLQLKEEHFDQLVGRTMIDVANEVEWRETERFVREELDQLTIDSIANGLLLNPDTFITSFPDSNLHDTVNDGSSDTRTRRDYFSQDQGRRGRRDEPPSYQEKLANQVVARWFMTPQSIEERISQVELSELLNRKFSENGLGELDYEYAVVGWNQQIAYQSGSFSFGEEAEYYDVQLFPGDVQPHTIRLYFKGSQNAVFPSLGYIVISSLTLSLFIIIGFALAVYVMFKQKKLSEIRNDFVSNMTHELKTPISTISLAAQMLGDKTIPLEVKKQDRISDIITEECRRLGTQVEKVLQTAIFDKGKLKLHLQDIDLHEIIGGAIENFSFQVRSRNGKITSSLKAENHHIIADQVHIINVLSNLLDNALKYCTREPRIHIETSGRDQFIRIVIQDNGVGIGKNDQRRIFEKFYRVPTGNIHTVKGFGLGLSYVKMIVEEHGGQIDLESELYEGSKFSITLPVKAKE